MTRPKGEQIFQQDGSRNMPLKEASMQHPTSCGHNILDTQDAVSYTAHYEKEVLINNIAPELSPIPGKYQTWSRDYEYKRLGTVSLLAGIDLHDGRVIALVKERHRSLEFTEFLGLLHQQYHESWRIRIILDNHSAHISKETMQWLKQYPQRFEFVFTPKHGSWLNLIEVFFSKMARSFLRSIRVNSTNELIERIYKYINEVNAEPIVFKWKYKLDEVIV